MRRFFGAVLLMAVLCVGISRPADAGFASIVIDANTGDVLHQVNPDTLNYPASLTKMMTLYIAFDALKGGRIKLQTAAPVSEHAAAQAPSKLGLRPGTTIRVVDAIYALITKSANDAAVVLAEEIGGTEWEFARMMTAKAAELGMPSTVFRNASGLPDLNQITTARDLARLSQALIQDHPEFYKYFAAESYDYQGRTLESHNRFMKAYPGADGIKTGFIRASGFNLAGSAVRNGRRLIAVVMGAETARWRDLHMAALMDRAFGNDTGAALVASTGGSDAADGEDDETRVVWTAAQAARALQTSFTPEAKRARGAGEVPVINIPAETKPSGRAREIETIKKAPSRSAAASADKGSWTIQVGVFSDKANARKSAQEAVSIADLPSHAKIGITQIKPSRKQLYRARLSGMSRNAALDACKKLEKHKRDCMAFDSDT